MIHLYTQRRRERLIHNYHKRKHTFSQVYVHFWVILLNISYEGWACVRACICVRHQIIKSEILNATVGCCQYLDHMLKLYFSVQCFSCPDQKSLNSAALSAQTHQASYVFCESLTSGPEEHCGIQRQFFFFTVWTGRVQPLIKTYLFLERASFVS